MDALFAHIRDLLKEVKEKDLKIVKLKEEMRPYKENVKLLGDSLDKRVKEIAELKAEIERLNGVIGNQQRIIDEGHSRERESKETESKEDKG